MVTVCPLYRMSSKGKHYRNVRRPVAASGWGTETSGEVGLRGGDSVSDGRRVLCFE